MDYVKVPHSVESVVATMAVENMCPSKEVIDSLIQIANGERTSEEVRQEALKKYVR